MVGLYFQVSGLCLLSLCVMSVGRMVLVHNSRESLTDQLSCSVRVKCCCYKGGWKSLIKFTEQFRTEMERSEYAASPGLSSPVSLTAPVSHTARASHVCVIVRTHSVHVYQGGVIHGRQWHVVATDSPQCAGSQSQVDWDSHTITPPSCDGAEVLSRPDGLRHMSSLLPPTPASSPLPPACCKHYQHDNGHTMWVQCVQCVCGLVRSWRSVQPFGEGTMQLSDYVNQCRVKSTLKVAIDECGHSLNMWCLLLIGWKIDLN